MTPVVGTTFLVPTTGVIYVNSYNFIYYSLCKYQNFGTTSRSPWHIFVYLYMTRVVGTTILVPTTGVIYVKSYNCICYFLCGYQILAPQVNALVIAKLKIFLHCCVKGLNGRSLIIHPAPADSISIYRQLINFTWIRKKDVHRRFLI